MSDRPLRAVSDPVSGEVAHACPNCSKLQDQLDGAEKDIRAWRARWIELKRDRDGEARKHPLWPTALELFKVWRVECNHPNSAWGPDRFEQIRPFLETKKYGKTIEDRAGMCLRAIAGAAYDPFKSERKNGTTRRADSWDLIFRTRDKFEDFCNRAPRDWRPPSREDQQALET